MVKIIVDKIDGHIVYLRYFEEMDENRMETLVFDLDSYKTIEHSKGIDDSILDIQNRKFTLHGKKQAKSLKFL